MNIQRFEGNGRLSKAVAYNGVLYICGQTGSPTKNLKEQTVEILDNIEKILDKHGSDKYHLLTAAIYLQEGSMFDDFNSVWDTWIPSGYEPTRACIESKACVPGKLVEIVVSAALK